MVEFLLPLLLRHRILFKQLQRSFSSFTATSTRVTIQMPTASGGADFHSTTEYCTFVKGYSRTRSDDVHIDNTTQLSNGTVQVLATTNTTEDTGAGTTMKVYHETYIVGQENGAWRILRGTQI